MQIQHSDDGNAQKQLGVAFVLSQTSEIYRLGKDGWRREGREKGGKTCDEDGGWKIMRNE